MSCACNYAGLPHLVHHFYRHEYAHHYSSNAIVTSSSTMHCLFFNCHPLEHESIKNWPMEHLNKLVEFFAKFHLYLYPNWPSLSEHTWKQRSVSIDSLDYTFLSVYSLQVRVWYNQHFCKSGCCLSWNCTCKGQQTVQNSYVSWNLKWQRGYI